MGQVGQDDHEAGDHENRHDDRDAGDHENRHDDRLVDAARYSDDDYDDKDDDDEEEGQFNM